MKIIPPRATRRPLTSTHHGIVRVDDYAWLRASNWQAVMRNPAVLDPDIRAQLEAEKMPTHQASWPTQKSCNSFSSPR